MDRVWALLDEIKQEGDAATVMQARLEHGESISGFGHKLYPHGDPRATPLMKSAQFVAGKRKEVKFLWELVGESRLHHQSNRCLLLSFVGRTAERRQLS